MFDPDGFAPMARMSASGSLGLVSDHMSVPLVALDEQGAAVWQGFLDTRGVMEHEGDAALVPWRFAGQYRDPETGLHYNRHRYYDPGTEGFISPDPIGLAGGLRVYGYVEDPLGWIDPLGLAKQSQSGCENDAAEGGERSAVSDLLDIKRQKGLGDIAPGTRSHAETLGEAWVNGPNVKRFDLDHGGYGLTDGTRTFRLQYKRKDGVWKANFQENRFVQPHEGFRAGRGKGIQTKNVHMTITDMSAP